MSDPHQPPAGPESTSVDRKLDQVLTGAAAPEPRHDHEPPRPVEDSGTQALSEALQSSFVIVRVVLVLLILLFFASGIFTVGPQEVALKLRLGKPVGEGEGRLLQPGLHWRFPSPIDEIVKIPKGQVHVVRSTVGWYRVTPEQELSGQEPAATPSLTPGVDGYTMTADGNFIHVRATLRYYISDPLTYEFNFHSTSNHILNAINNALNYASARFTVDQATRTDQAAFKEKIMARVALLADLYQLGITFDPRNADIVAIPPRQVRDAFNKVLESEQERSKTINRAQAEANELVRRAEGEAESRKNAALAEHTGIVQSAQADALYFQARLPEFQRNAALFQQRRLSETMAIVLTNATDKFFVLDRGAATARQLRLLLNREPEKFKIRPRPLEEPNPEDIPDPSDL